MRPVTVKEILTYGERLGITEIAEPPGAAGSVRHLFRYAEGEAGPDRTPLPHSMLILSPVAGEGAYEKGWSRPVPPSLFPKISCLALSSQRLTPSLRKFSDRTGTVVFSSRYDNTLFHSRMTALLRERGGRRSMVHGVLVQVCGFGVLLLGKSGMGKTACGLALMAEGQRWVADDAVVLEGRGKAVYGRGHHRIRGWIAVRGRGILRAADLFGAERLLRESRVDLIIRLVCTPEGDSVQKSEPFQELVGVSLPCRNLAADADPGRMAEQVRNEVRSLSVKSAVCAADREKWQG